MPVRAARNAVRSSVLTQADVHFEAFSAGRRAPAELGLPSDHRRSSLWVWTMPLGEPWCLMR